MGLFSGWRYHGRKNWRLWPFRVTMNRNGFFSLPKFSWGIWTKYYKRSFTTGAQSIDTPGMGGLRKRRARRRRR